MCVCGGVYSRVHMHVRFRVFANARVSLRVLARVCAFALVCAPLDLRYRASADVIGPFLTLSCWLVRFKN